MKRGLLAAAVLLTATIMLSGQEVRRALPAQSVAADDVAKFLAGVPLPPASPLSALRQSPGVCRARGGPRPSFPALRPDLFLKNAGMECGGARIPNSDEPSRVLFFCRT